MVEWKNIARSLSFSFIFTGSRLFGLVFLLVIRCWRTAQTFIRTASNLQQLSLVPHDGAHQPGGGVVTLGPDFAFLSFKASGAIRFLTSGEQRAMF
jgi:hypothetical protein